jgi:hypothetical protein
MAALSTQDVQDLKPTISENFASSERASPSPHDDLYEDLPGSGQGNSFDKTDMKASNRYNMAASRGIDAW